MKRKKKFINYEEQFRVMRLKVERKSQHITRDTNEQGEKNLFATIEFLNF